VRVVDFDGVGRLAVLEAGSGVQRLVGGSEGSTRRFFNTALSPNQKLELLNSSKTQALLLASSPSPPYMSAWPGTTPLHLR
jgi:hypothetical protein